MIPLVFTYGSAPIVKPPASIERIASEWVLALSLKSDRLMLPGMVAVLMTAYSSRLPLTITTSGLKPTLMARPLVPLPT